MANTLDLNTQDLRDVNVALQEANGTDAQTAFEVNNARGDHALAVGLDAPLDVVIHGHTGYYAAGMNKSAHIVIEGNAGQGVAENMMSGHVHVRGDAGASAGATAHGGTLIVEGNSGSRTGISMKGANIAVRGNVGHLSCFMAQAGVLVVGGDAGDALGDSIYETHIYVRGNVKSLGADCEKKEMRPEHVAELQAVLDEAGFTDMKVEEFTRYGSARQLYHWNAANSY